jgi:hypothetical protein
MWIIQICCVCHTNCSLGHPNLSFGYLCSYLWIQKEIHNGSQIVHKNVMDLMVKIICELNPCEKIYIKKKLNENLAFQVPSPPWWKKLNSNSFTFSFKEKGNQNLNFRWIWKNFNTYMTPLISEVIFYMHACGDMYYLYSLGFKFQMLKK